MTLQQCGGISRGMKNKMNEWSETFLNNIMTPSAFSYLFIPATGRKMIMMINAKYMSMKMSKEISLHCLLINKEYKDIYRNANSNRPLRPFEFMLARNVSVS